MNLFKPAFIGLLLLQTLTTVAQQTPPTEKKSIYFRIKDVLYRHDSMIGLLDGGSKQGIKIGLTGPVNATHIAGTERSGKEIGFASVTRVNDSTAELLLKPSDQYTGDSTYFIYPNDCAIFDISIPKLPYHSVFFDLAGLNILFVDNYRDPIYQFTDLLNQDGKPKELTNLQACADAVKEIYESFSSSTDAAFDVLKKPMQESRYAGKTGFEVMRDCKPSDILAFLNFVKTYPGKYIGNSWKISETFATWVINNAPYSKAEIKDSVLMNLKKPIALKQFFERNKSIIAKEGFINTWLVDAVEEPDSLFNLSMLAARTALSFIPDNNTWGDYYLNYAQWYIEKKQSEKALPACDTAIDFYTKAANPGMVALTFSNKARACYNLEKYTECITVLDKALAYINNPANRFDSSNKYYRSRYYNLMKGYSYYMLNDLKPAASCLRNAINLYKQTGVYNDINSATEAQDYLAKVYKKQGENIKELEIYNEQLALYNKLNDNPKIASTLNNIALAEFNLANYKDASAHYSAAKKIYLLLEDYDNAGFTQSNAGQVYWTWGKYDSAIAAHREALTYRRMANSNYGLGYAWEKIGGLYNATGEQTKAFTAYDSSEYYYKLANDTTSLRSLLSSRGDTYYNNKQYQQAFEYYNKWYVLNKAANDKPAVVNSLYWMGVSAGLNNDEANSKKFSLECLAMAKDIGDKSNEYYANQQLGFLSYRKFNYDEGNKYFNSALQIALEQKNKEQEAYLYKTIASSYSSSLLFDKATPLLNKAKFIYDSLGNQSKLAECYRISGGILQGMGDFYAARNEYEKSITIAREAGSRADVAYGYSALTFLYIIQGDLAKAEQVTDSTYAIFKLLGNDYQIAEAYFNMALVAEAKSDGITAIKYYTIADSLYQKEQDVYSQASCNTNTGAVLFYQADYKNALRYFEKADSILNTIPQLTEAHILAPINIGECVFYLKDFKRAEANLKKGYDLATEKKAGRMQNIAASFLGKLYYETKNPDAAEKYLLESFAISEKSNETDLYINTGITLGKLYASKTNNQQADYYFGKTTGFINKIDNSKYTWWALYEYGLYLFNQSKYDSAVNNFKRAVAIVEKESQNLFGGAEAKKIYSADERKVDLYNKLVVALAKSNNKEEALFYANQSNVQAVKEQMEKAGLSTTDKDKASAISKSNELLQKKNAVEQAIAKEKSKPEKEQNKQLIASLESIKNVAETDYTNFIEQMQRSYPDLQAYFSNTNPKDFRNYIDDIPDSVLVALYIVNDKQLYIFTVNSKETAIKTIELKEDINQEAGRLLSILRNPKNATGTGAIKVRSSIDEIEDVRGDFKTEAKALYDLLITPIADELKDKKNLCVITNGKLGSIPFESLGTTDDKNNFHFLIEDYNVFYTSKIDIFRKSYKDRKIESSIAVFGNPDKSLAAASEEATEIAKIIPHSTVYTESQATEAKAKESLQNYNYVHFATHGVLNYTNFDESYLLFAPGTNGTDDGKLTIKEINGLTKQTNSMVVLSACETAVSKEEVKGWYISPANAFLTNRVDAVLGSLWKVSDDATNLLLQEFYKNLYEKHMSKAAALRYAQATVSQDPKFAHPYFWSAFVLYGDWR